MRITGVVLIIAGTIVAGVQIACRGPEAVPDLRGNRDRREQMA